MLKKSFLFWLMMLGIVVILIGCQTKTSQVEVPFEGSYEFTNTPSPTVEAGLATNIARSTEIASYTTTVTPSVTPTPTPALPVSHREPFPGDIVSLNADNLSQIKLIGTYGEGDLYSIHYNELDGRLVIVYSTGIEVYSLIGDRISYERSYDFDLQMIFFPDYERQNAYLVSESTHFFVQNYGHQLKILDLYTGDENFITLDQQSEKWNKTIEEVSFSANENYLIIDAENEQIVVDMSTFQIFFQNVIVNGQSMISGDEHYFFTYTDTNYEIYELPSFKLIDSDLISTNSEITWMTITNKGQLIIVYSDLISVWQLPGVEKKGEINTYTVSSNKFEVARDGKYLVVGSTFGNYSVKIWNLEKMSLEKSFPDTYLFQISPDEKNLLIGGDQKVLYQFDTKAVFTNFGEDPMGFTADGSILYSCRSSRGVRIYDTSKEDLSIGYQYDYQSPVYCVTSESSLWAYLRLEHKLFQIDLSTFTEKEVFKDIPNGQLFLTVSDEFAYYTGEDYIEIRSLKDMKLIQRLTLRKEGTDYLPAERIIENYEFYEYDIHFPAFAADISWGIDKASLKDAFTYMTQPIQGGPRWLPYLQNSISPDGQYQTEVLFGHLYIHNTGDGGLIETAETELNTIYDFVYSPDSKLLYISGYYDPEGSGEQVLIYDIGTDKIIKRFDYIPQYVDIADISHTWGIPIDVSPNGRYLAIGNDLGGIKVLDLENDYEELYSLDIFMYPGGEIQFSPDGSYLATMAGGDSVQFWDAQTGDFITEISVLGGYNPEDFAMIKFYLMDNVILAAETTDPFGGFGQIKVYGVLSQQE